MCDFLDNACIRKDVLSEIQKNRDYNKQICQYYDRFSTWDSSVAFDRVSLDKKLLRVLNCNKSWWMDYYPMHQVKDFQKTFLCGDKFCANCKKVKQAGRMAKYIPEIEPYKNILFHLTLTVPNCIGVDLRQTIKDMAKNFKYLIRIITGDKKISGLCFDDWGYQGAIRSLEITFKKNSYHPHYHVMLALKDFSFEDSDRKIINDFSYSYGKLVRLFHTSEILIQKIWYLIINGITVNTKNIDNLKRGYSCTIDKFREDDYAELFKYMTKETDEDGGILTYENFISLYYGTFRIKQIQGYGIFYRITDDGMDLESLEDVYNAYMDIIRAKENPQAVYQTVEDLKNDNENMIISRKSYFKYLNNILLNDNK